MFLGHESLEYSTSPFCLFPGPKGTVSALPYNPPQSNDVYLIDAKKKIICCHGCVLCLYIRRQS